MFEDFKSNLEDKKKKNLYRSIPSIEGIDFSSNDYLSLRYNSQIKQKLCDILKSDIPLSAGASPLLGGVSHFHIKAETALKKFTGRPAVLMFPSGYQANLGGLSLLAKNRTVFSDELNHASLIDGIRLSQSPYHIFKHNNLDHLEELMKKTSQAKIIVTESLFSMSGTLSNLKDLSKLAIKYKALLFVDEAHSTGLFGKNLGGRVSELKQKEHIISLHTGGKALASFGAWLSCSVLIKKYLINNCRSFIYSTAPAPLLMAQYVAVLEFLKKEGAMRVKKLKENSLNMRKALSLLETKSPILFINLKTAEKALQTSRELKKHGYFIPAIRYPTVPKNKQGLRIVVNFNHSKKQLEDLTILLKELL